MVTLLFFGTCRLLGYGVSNSLVEQSGLSVTTGYCLV